MDPFPDRQRAEVICTSSYDAGGGVAVGITGGVVAVEGGTGVSVAAGTIAGVDVAGVIAAGLGVGLGATVGALFSEQPAIKRKPATIGRNSIRMAKDAKAPLPDNYRPITSV